MKHVATFLAIFSVIFLASCIGLEYPDYWNGDDNTFVNLITLPFEIVFTPIIFLIKLLPIL